ncbi:MAG: hypothetical protein QOJ06_1872 [Pseudonocardiales bacterium]|nr:hypothetical protein [Pseudonocardiales bacterium]
MIPRNQTTHKLLTMASGMLGGALAGALFKRFWRSLSDEPREVPEPTALEHNLREVLVVAALQGAVSGLIRAALGRIAEQGYRRFSVEELER